MDVIGNVKDETVRPDDFEGLGSSKAVKFWTSSFGITIFKISEIEFKWY